MYTKKGSNKREEAHEFAAAVLFILRGWLRLRLLLRMGLVYMDLLHIFAGQIRTIEEASRSTRICCCSFFTPWMDLLHIFAGRIQRIEWALRNTLFATVFQASGFRLQGWAYFTRANVKAPVTGSITKWWPNSTSRLVDSWMEREWNDCICTVC